MAHDMLNHRNDIFDAMNDWFDLPHSLLNETNFSNKMQADVSENEKEYTVKVDMPGMDKNKISVNYNHGILSVAGSRYSETSQTDKQNIIHQERSSGHISRSFHLPNVTAKGIHAQYEDGVLNITLPKEKAADNNHAIPID